MSFLPDFQEKDIDFIKLFRVRVIPAYESMI